MIRKTAFFLSLVLSLAMSFFVIKIRIPNELYLPLVLWIGFYLGLIALWFIFTFIFSLFLNKKKEYTTQNRLVDRIISLTMELLLNLAHVKILKENIEAVPKDEKFLLVYNHTSNFDPIIINHVLRKYKIIHVSKPENFKIPIAGPFVHRNCYQAIDRESPMKALKTIDKCIGFINENKFSVGIAPEGTRNKGNDKELLPFKGGCFHIAKKTNCKIVICALMNANKIHKNFPFKRTKVKFSIVKVMDCEEYKDLRTSDISNTARDLIQRKLYEKEETL